eukprot:2194318-Pyramimonas_sp.AAC.2
MAASRSVQARVHDTPDTRVFADSVQAAGERVQMLGRMCGTVGQVFQLNSKLTPDSESTICEDRRLVVNIM